MSAPDPPQAESHPLEAVAWTASDRYPLDVEEIRLLADVTNTLFRVRTATQGDWVLRVGVAGRVGHPPAVIESEMTWLEALARDTSLWAPRPLRTCEGEWATQVPVAGEARSCVVFSWMPGEVLAKVISSHAMRAFGRYAALMHRYGAQFTPPPGFTIPSYDTAFPFDRPVVLFDESQAGLVSTEARQACRLIQQRVDEAITRLADREPPRITHGDLYASNAMLDGDTVGVFDFEDMMWGWPVQDVAGTFFTLWKHPDYREFLAAYRTGYESVEVWPEREPGEIATFMAGRSLMLANDVLLEPRWRHEAEEILTETMERLGTIQ